MLKCYNFILIQTDVIMIWTFDHPAWFNWNSSYQTDFYLCLGLEKKLVLYSTFSSAPCTILWKKCLVSFDEILNSISIINLFFSKWFSKQSLYSTSNNIKHHISLGHYHITSLFVTKSHIKPQLLISKLFEFLKEL